jgi:hypothetical protein
MFVQSKNANGRLRVRTETDIPLGKQTFTAHTHFCPENESNDDGKRRPLGAFVLVSKKWSSGYSGGKVVSVVLKYFRIYYHGRDSEEELAGSSSQE